MPTSPPLSEPSPAGSPAAWQAALHGAVVAEAAELGLLSFTGADAASFLHAQLSSDVKSLAPGAGHRSTYNSPKGRLLATLFVYRHGDDRYEALVAADLADALRKRLSMFVLRSKVVIADESPGLARLGVGGPHAAEAVAAACGLAPAPSSMSERESVRAVHLPDGRLVILAPEAAAEGVGDALRRHATPAPPDVWRWLGIRLGVPLVTAATQDLFVAQTANQDALGGLDFRKGCYPGQEIVARTQYLGRLKERLYVMSTDAAPPAPATRLYAPAFGEQACGTVVGSAPQPTGGSLLLGVLQTDAASGPIALGAPDGPRAVIEPLPYPLPEPAEPRGRVRL